MKIFYEVSNYGRFTNVTVQKKNDVSEFEFKKKKDGTKIGKRTYQPYFSTVEHAFEILLFGATEQLNPSEGANYNIGVHKAKDKELFKKEFVNKFYNINI